MAAEFKMAVKLTLFSQSLKSMIFSIFVKLIYTLTDYRIFGEIQNGESIQDGANFGEIFQEL
jgi:hypothetical protein